MIYLDHAATTPIRDEAVEVYRSVSQSYFGNPNSLHDAGSSSKQILKASARTVAKTLNADANDIYFTSGATEGNLLSILSILKGIGAEKGHLITTQIEHASVSNVFDELEKRGYEVTRLGVDSFGKVDLDELQDSIKKDTLLASIQYVNSEIGTIQDVEKIGTILNAHNVIYHSDCVQAYGKLPIDVQKSGLHALTISAHKIYGPKGMGAVWINPQTNWESLIPEHSKKKTLKQGTPDIPAIAAFAAAAKIMESERKVEEERILKFRNSLLDGFRQNDMHFEVEGHPENSVPNILGLRFPGMEGQFFMLECNQAGIAISTGSACQAGMDAPNKTMIATGKTEQEAREFVRLSFGKKNQEDQIPLIIEKMNAILTLHLSKINHHEIHSH